DLSPLTPDEQEIIGRALAKDPDQRHPSCMDMVRGLRAAAARSVPRAPMSEKDHNSDSPSSVRTEGRRKSKRIGRRITPPPAVNPEAGPTPISATANVDPSSGRKEVDLDDDRGILVPAVVIGLGGTGLAALQEFRDDLRQRFGAATTLPHLRLLYI